MIGLIKLMSKPHRESKTFSKEDKEIFVFEDM